MGILNKSETGLYRTGVVAFVVVVAASYVSVFLQMKLAGPVAVLFVALGFAYTFIGLYGFHLCRTHKKPWLKMAFFALEIPLGGWIIYLGRGIPAFLLFPLISQGVMLLSTGGALFVSFIGGTAIVAVICLHEGLRGVLENSLLV